MSSIAPPATSRYLAGMPSEALSQALWERYQELLDSGTSSDRILVWLENSTRSHWTALLKGEPEEHIAPEARPFGAGSGLQVPTGAQRVHTPAAFIKEELRLWWPIVDAQLEAWGFASKGPEGISQAYSEPCFVAIDLAQYLMNRFTTELRLEGANCLEGVETPPHLQNIQLLDALARGIENGYSLRSDEGTPPAEHLARTIAKRLNEGAGETRNTIPIFKGVESCLRAYIEQMLAHRCLDHGLQLELYASVLFEDPRYRKNLLEHLSHLLVERMDELPPRYHHLIRTLEAEGIPIYSTLQLDAGRNGLIRGGLRAYVGADAAGAWELAKSWKEEALEPPAHTEAQAALAAIGRALHDSVLGGEGRALALPPGVITRSDRYIYEEMLDVAVKDLFELLDEGVEREEVAFVAPAIDAFLLWGLKNRLEARDIPLYVFAGTNRLVQHRPVRILLTMAKLCHPEWQSPPGRYEWIELLEVVTGLNPLLLGRLADKMTSNHGLGHPDQLELLGENLTEASRLGYFELYHWIERQRESRLELPAFLRAAFAERYAPARMLAAQTPGEDEAWQREVSQIGQLIELSESYQALLKRVGPPAADSLEPRHSSWEWSFLRFLYAGTIAERPFFRREPHRVSVMLASASQLAEKGNSGRDRPLRHLYLLDFGSTRYLKRDRKELTNARVLAPAWPGGTYGIDAEERDAAEKLAKTLWALCRLPSESIRVFASMTDAEGREQAGELPWLLETIVGRKAGAS